MIAAIGALAAAWALAGAIDASAGLNGWTTTRAYDDRRQILSDPVAADLGSDGYALVGWDVGPPDIGLDAAPLTARSVASRGRLSKYRSRVVVRMPGDGSFGAPVTRRGALGIQAEIAEHEGTAIVAWYQAGKGTQLRFHTPADGFGPITTLSPRYAQLAVAEDGTAVLAWAGRSAVRAAIREPGGGFGPSFSVADVRAYEPLVATTEGGGIAIGWQGKGQTSPRVIVRRPGSTEFTNPRRVPIAVTDGDWFAALAMSDDGTVIAGSEDLAIARRIWSRLVASVMPSDANAFGDPVRISGNSVAYDFLLDASADGRFVSAWNRPGRSQYRRYESGSWGPIETLASKDDFISGVDAAPSGATILGIDGVGSGCCSDLRAAVAMPPGDVPFEPVATIRKRAGDFLVFPGLAVNDAGDALIAWSNEVFGPGTVFVSDRPASP